MNTEHVAEYHTSLARYLAIFEREARSMAFAARDAKEYADWKAKVRSKLAEITGMARMERTSEPAAMVESTACRGYRREKWLLPVEPGVRMPFYALVPDGITDGERRPCIIATHGHMSGGKNAVAGRRDLRVLRKTIRLHHYDYGERFARDGYVVLCPDARAFGERREWMHQGDTPRAYLDSSCIPLNHLAICLGRTVTGMWTWDLMRLLDYLATRSDCDPGRTAVAGLSGGGLQALWLAAMDDRLRAAVVSGYFYGYRDSLLKLSDNCGCNYVPRLWEFVDMGDLGALVAPRHLLIESGLRDNLNGERGIANVHEQLAVTRGAYDLLGAADRLRHHVFDGPHRWDGAATPSFLAEAFAAH